MERKEIKKMLPSGYGPYLASKTGYTKMSIYNWFKGKNDNVNIENAALQYLAEVLEKRKELNARIKSLL